MMQTRDWVIGLIGAAILLVGLLPLLGMLEFLSSMPKSISAWIISIAALILLYASIVEITNSNVIGWWSFMMGAIFMIIGILPVLFSLGIGPTWFDFTFLTGKILNILFIVEGAFLTIATFAMEL